MKIYPAQIEEAAEDNASRRHMLNMTNLHYYQYAFSLPTCRVQAIGAGVDPRFQVKLICDGPIAAMVSHVGLDQFDPNRLQGKAADDIRWLNRVAARHNEIVCQAAFGSAVLPLHTGVVFDTRDSLEAVLRRCQATVARFLDQLDKRLEWSVKLYMQRPQLEATAAHANPPAPHYLTSAPKGCEKAASGSMPILTSAENQGSHETPLSISSQPPNGTDYLAQRKAELESRRQLRAAVQQAIQTVEQRLVAKTEHCCRIRTLPSDLTGRSQEMIYNAAFLVSPDAQESWLSTILEVREHVCQQGLSLEVSGPWPPYHFCPNLEM